MITPLAGEIKRWGVRRPMPRGGHDSGRRAAWFPPTGRVAPAQRLGQSRPMAYDRGGRRASRRYGGTGAL